MVDVGRIPRWPIYGRKSNSTGWGKSRSDPQRNGKPKQFFVGERVTVCDFHVFFPSPKFDLELPVPRFQVESGLRLSGH